MFLLLFFPNIDWKNVCRGVVLKLISCLWFHWNVDFNNPRSSYFLPDGEEDSSICFFSYFPPPLLLLVFRNCSFWRVREISLWKRWGTWGFRSGTWWVLQASPVVVSSLLWHCSCPELRQAVGDRLRITLCSPTMFMTLCKQLYQEFIYWSSLFKEEMLRKNLTAQGEKKAERRILGPMR